MLVRSPKFWGECFPICKLVNRPVAGCALFLGLLLAFLPMHVLWRHGTLTLSSRWLQCARAGGNLNDVTGAESAMGRAVRGNRKRGRELEWKYCGSPWGASAHGQRNSLAIGVDRNRKPHDPAGRCTGGHVG